MDADKLYGKGKAFPLSLPEIFIPLFTYKPGESLKKGKKIDEERKPDDIEEIISESDYLIIEGQAGSGKTTLLKHIAYCLAIGKNAECKIKGSDNQLPLLIQLKDLNEFFNALPKSSKNGSDAIDIIEWYIVNKLNGFLTVDIVKKYIEDKKTIILLDGLDELLPDFRDAVVNSFADLGIKYKGNKIIFTSRPHGVEGAAIKRFGDRHIKILSLETDQVNLFINKWFKYLYPGEKGIGRKNAEVMIGEIRVHPAINQLVHNPLMLTAICILYHDEKELPGQRAELYKKFIDNMLYRRFPDSEKVYTFLKKFAFTVNSSRVRGRDKSLCIEALSGVYIQKEDENKEDYYKRLAQTFDDIEAKCGLLKLEGGEFLFWHLSFQEFLTALYIVDNSRDYSEAIKLYWGDDWYKEVIELYIGYLSIDNKTWANGIVSDTLNAADKSPFKKWLLAAESLVDMNRDRRELEVEEKAKQRLLNIIETENDPKILFQAGENLGWLGDIRNLEGFIPVESGKYNLEELEEVDIKPFEIGQYPITNIWYSRFVKEGGYTNEVYWCEEGKKWLKNEGQKQPRYWDYHRWKCPNLPVVGVCWYEADAFCRWLTLTLKDGHIYRLPTEQEWQAAAGKEGRKYPWGEKWDKNRCNNGETGIGKTSPVGIFEKGRTPEKVYDLSGNVWEWTSTVYKNKQKKVDFNLGAVFEEGPVIRGGFWYYSSETCRCAIRTFFNPDNRALIIGFRCART
jgi:formylglycine-generating enzyme required for sulfatase activity